MGGPEGGAVASNPSHQGAAQFKIVSNIDSAGECGGGRMERGAELICRTTNLSRVRMGGEERKVERG